MINERDRNDKDGTADPKKRLPTEDEIPPIRDGFRVWSVKDLSERPVTSEWTNQGTGTRVHENGARIVKQEVTEMNPETEEDITYTRERYRYDDRNVDGIGGNYHEIATRDNTGREVYGYERDQNNRPPSEQPDDKMPDWNYNP
jgi:hypothetical protein